MRGARTAELLAPVSAADTAAATGTGVDVQDLDRDVVIVQQVGDVTGSIAGKIVTSDNSDLSNSSDIVAFALVESGPSIQAVHIPATLCRKYIGYVGTITTGPACVSASVTGQRQYAT